MTPSSLLARIVPLVPKGRRATSLPTCSVSLLAVALILSCSLAEAAVTGSSKGKISSARLSKKSFTSSQASSVTLTYKFSEKSKTFSYVLTFKKGSKWQRVKAVKKKGSFKGTHTTTVKKVFAGKAVKVGSYKLKLSADKGSKRLSFKVVKRPSGSSGGSTTTPTSTTPTTTGSDTTPPSTPSNLHVTAQTTTSVAVVWTASTDNVGVTGYSVYLNGSHITNATGPSATLSGLVCGQTYTVGVDAFDAAGNHSGTTSMSASTSACPLTGRVLASPCLNLRNGPYSSSTLVGCIPYNTIITISCTATGSAVTGPYGTESIWDYTSWSGTSGFVSDAWVYTGTNSAIAGPCSTPSREQEALNWLNAHAGSTAYNGLCELMVENAYGTSGQYPSALADYTAQKNAGLIHTDTNPPAGALVFYSGSDPSLGHVEISNGDGRYWTSDGTIHLVSFTWGGTYYGWSYAPANWPGA